MEANAFTFWYQTVSDQVIKVSLKPLWIEITGRKSYLSYRAPTELQIIVQQEGNQHKWGEVYLKSMTLGAQNPTHVVFD